MTTRPMTTALRTALDGLAASERRALQRMALELPAETHMARIVHGIAAELHVQDLAEQEVLTALARDHAADLEEFDARHPYPLPDPSMVFTCDPDTGEVRRAEDPR